MIAHFAFLRHIDELITVELATAQLLWKFEYKAEAIRPATQSTVKLFFLNKQETKQKYNAQRTGH